MLNEIYSPAFDTEQQAKRALTIMRNRYRIALRGAVPIESTYAESSVQCYRLHVPLYGTGFSAAEFSSALWSVREELARESDAKRRTEREESR